MLCKKFGAKRKLSCALLKRSWKAKTNCLPSTEDTVDDTLAMVPDIPSAEAFLTTLNESHPSITFTMEITTNNKLPFVGMEIEMKGNQLATRVHRKTTKKGLLLHYQSHVDNKYKHSLLKTMLVRAHRLSSSPDLFADECNNLKSMFLKLKYPPRLIESTINRYVRFTRSSRTTSPIPTRSAH